MIRLFKIYLTLAFLLVTTLVKMVNSKLCNLPMCILNMEIGLQI